MDAISSSRYGLRQLAQRSAARAIMGAACVATGLPACSLARAVLPHKAPMQAPAPPFVEPPAPEEISTDEEAGVAHLHGLLRCLDASLTQLQFAAAEDCLSHAERGLVRASSLTRSHPDFDDLEDSIQAARPRLSQAIEADRLAKRNQAIDALMARGQVALSQANAVGADLTETSRGAESLANLNASQTALTDLVRDGEGFMDTPRYIAFAATLQATLQSVTQLRDAAAWQLHTQERLAPVIEAGFAAVAQAKAGGEPAQQLAAYKDVAQAFAACTQIIDAAQTEPGARASLIFATRFGRLPLSDTYALCTDGGNQASLAINRFGWTHLLNQLAAVLPAAQDKGQKAAAALGAALPLLAACADGAPTPEDVRPKAAKAAISAKDVSQASLWTFKSPFGSLRIDALRRACAKEAQRLAPKQVGLAWQGRLETVVQRLAVAGSALKAATQTPPPKDAVPQLSLAKGGFDECAEAAQALADEPAADGRYAVAYGAARLNVHAVEKLCRQNAQVADGALKNIAAQVALQQFSEDCRGDERSVVAREGVPGHIETVGQGRIFVYGPHKRIAFDSQGQRIKEGTPAP